MTTPASAHPAGSRAVVIHYDGDRYLACCSPCGWAGQPWNRFLSASLEAEDHDREQHYSDGTTDAT